MTTFDCCKTKTFPNSYYICVSCVKVYHRSCVLRNKSKFTLIGGHKIRCCNDLEKTEQIWNEKSLLEETISELHETSLLREQHLKKLKEDHHKFIEEVTTRENELNALIKNQEEKMRSMQWELKKLRMELKSVSVKKLVTTSSTQTMTNTFVTRQTQTVNEVNIKHSITRINIKNKPITRKLIIVSGKQGKELANLLSRFLDHKLSVCAIVKPNASSNELVETAISLSRNLTMRDFLVFWPNINSSQHCRNLTTTLKHTNFLILTTPCRYDSMEINDRIYHSNLSLYKNIHSTMGTLSNLINVNKILRRSNYDDIGIHMRRTGKRYIAKHIAAKIRQILSLQDDPLSKKYENGKILVVPEVIKTARNICETSTHQVFQGENRLANEMSTKTHFLYPRLSQVASKD